jgi:hypothetical protein
MFEKKLTDLQRFILRQLALSEEGLSAYTLWSRFKLAADDIAKAMHPIIDKGFVVVDGGKISLTEEGIELLHGEGQSLYWRGERPWRQCPPEFCQSSIAPFEPVVPVVPGVCRSLLSDRVFKRDLTMP